MTGPRAPPGYISLAMDAATGRRLAERTLGLVNIPSVSRDESAIAAEIASAVPRASFSERFANGEGFFYSTEREPDRPLVLLAGHLDTIPIQDNLPGRIEAGWVVGAGSSDMKGGLAVMLELASWLEDARPDREIDLGLLFFTREELPVDESPLPAVFEACPEIREVDLAIALEPTDNTIQAGCLGNLNATLRFRGVSAHSARPWHGENAIAAAVEGLLPLTRIPPTPIEIEGLTFTEVLNVTQIRGGIADNVIPDSVECRLNYRFAPNRTLEEAKIRLASLVGDVGELDITSHSPPGRVSVRTPLVERLRIAGDYRIEPKQAWTPVAQFTDEGIDAVNLGPGATAYAHKQDEQVAVSELGRTFEALQRFVAGPI